MIRFAGIIIEFATASEIDRLFTYIVPEEMEQHIKVGQRVKVPFGKGNKLQLAYVVSLMNEVPPSRYRLKEISCIIDKEPIIDRSQWQIIDFMVRFYGTSVAAAIDTVLPPGLKDQELVSTPEMVKIAALTEDSLKVRQYEEAHGHKQNFMKQRILIQYLKNHQEASLEQLTRLENFSSSSLKTLKDKGIVKIEEREVPFVADAICYEAFKTPTNSQQEAIDYLEALNEVNSYRTILLEGVTGSGKTEVFLHAIKNLIEKGQTALVLVPEIALTSQTLSRFKERFGNRVALTHSRMGVRERQRLYMDAKEGRLSVVIGPRSAVFMPLPHLKMIIVDEAHDQSYKSEVEPKYHAIDIAKERMKENKGQVLLATATPSLESYYEVQEGRYDLIELNNRIGEAALPDVQVVDMRVELAQGNTTVFSRSLFEAIEQTVKQGQQVMLLINRRGYSTFINCRSCGYVVKCPHCDVALTHHAAEHNLQCHYCGYTADIPEICPSCGSQHIRFFGTGTEKVEAFVNKYFSEYGVVRMDTDTTTGKEGHKRILEAFREKKAHILIGTQMIAKGHDFKDVTLVGILSADASLFMQDFRSNEKTYQLLTQAIGRAGRGANKGKVIIQTYNPDHFIMNVVKEHKQEIFYEQELMNRKAMGYPPYTHVFSVLMTGMDEGHVIRTMHTLSQYFKYYSTKGKHPFKVIGPSSSVISKVGDEYRWRLLILGEFRDKLLVYGKFCLDKFYSKEQINGIKIGWDIDSLGML